MKFILRILLFTIFTTSFFIFLPKPASTNENFIKVDLTSVVNQRLQTFLKDPPTGNVTLAGIPFFIPNAESNNLILTEKGGTLPGLPAQVEVGVDIQNPEVIHILINTCDTFIKYNNLEVGKVILKFDDGSQQEIILTVGENVRELVIGNVVPIVGTVTDPASTVAWQGKTSDGSRTAAIDKLAIPIPISSQTKTLKSITFTDLSAVNGTDLDPCLVISAITVETSPPPTFDPIIIVPGIGASFNWEVMGDVVNFTTENWFWSPGTENAWKDFKKSLELAGLKENKDYFVAFYDWRKTNDWRNNSDIQPADYLRLKIDEALSQNPDANEVDIVAHSFGGIVARSYIQAAGYRKDVDQLITIGTPHQGAAFAYFPWEGGRVPPTWDAVSRFGLESYITYLQARHLTGFTILDTIHQFIPSIKDLLPINYNFLYRKDNGNEINWTSMSEVNNFLKDALNPNNAVSEITLKGVKLTNFASKSQQTWKQIEVEPYQNSFGKFWKDGKPTNQHKDGEGDGTVLFSSAVLPSAEVITAIGKHSEIIKIASPGIFIKLGIPYEAPASPTPIIERILGIFGGSPIEITVIDSDGNTVGESTTDPQTGFTILLVPNPDKDIYQIKVSGTDKGTYHLTVNLDDENSTQSTEISGFAASGSEATFTIDLTEQQNETLNFERSDTIDSLIENIQTAYDLGQIKNRGVKISLQQTLNAAKRLEGIAQNRPTKQILRAFTRQVEALRGKLIDDEAADILVEVVEYVINKLN